MQSVQSYCFCPLNMQICNVFVAIAVVVAKAAIKARLHTLTPTRCGQHITHAHNHFTRSISSHGQLFRPFGPHQHGVANIPGGCPWLLIDRVKWLCACVMCWPHRVVHWRKMSDWSRPCHVTSIAQIKHGCHRVFIRSPSIKKNTPSSGQ